MSVPKALFVQSMFSAHGGGHAVAAWMLEALKADYDVTVLTWRPADLNRINQVFGTSLEPRQFQWIYPSAVSRAVVERIPDESDLQKLIWLIRICKQIQSRYDVLLTADGEVDFGRPGIQYVHYPHLAPHYENLRRFGSVRGWRVIPATVQRVCRPWMLVGDFSFERMRQNLTLANSHWTAGVYQSRYGKRAEVLYPPAAGEYRRAPWELRASEFVCVSRLEAHKNHLRIIEIIRRVREGHPGVKLRIIGTRCGSPAGEAYYQSLARVVRENSAWVKLHEGISRSELSHWLSRARYGIHLLPDEHFGMAVAEMVSAGVIPFVHNSGGQVEIAEQPELLFDDDADAVRRINAVLSEPQLSLSLHARVVQSAGRFTPEKFCSQLVRRVGLWQRRAEAAA
jgi:glycosyltransferase involved in cell wall biosynthesis